ncbi:MAG: NAD(P)H-dependent glycerol-3-phosphate dehydrogenase [Candidatus Dependentiae bacterium]|nr:NAD(P)H-dependent glycerol-3-phosphate dehydrogenase [Candidatus Dependentiae bacterium]
MKITMLGDGAFGTACAMLFADNGHTVELWCYNRAVAEEIEKRRTNSQFLPGFTIPAGVRPTTDLGAAMANEVIFEAIPVPYMRSVFEKVEVPEASKKLWVILSKGIEAETLMFPSQILSHACGGGPRIAVLSGPSFARELAKKQPTILSIAAVEQADAEMVGKICGNSYCCCVFNDDMLAIQLLGALKNVVALGVGLLAGAGFGENTRIFFVLRCLDEIGDLLFAYGCGRKRLWEPAGIGDLMLTSFSPQSRNYQRGFELGEGKGRSDALGGGATAEGLNTIRSVCDMAQARGLHLSVIGAVAAVVVGGAGLERLIKTIIGD